jgi:signal transduction histidine kinase
VTRLFNLSLRYKIPLWGGLLITVSVLAVSAALMAKAYDDLRQDVRISAEGLAHTLGQTLFPALLHDDAWRAFEQINAAFAGRRTGNPVQPESIFVVDAEGQILVSSAPRELPMLTRIQTLGPDYARLAAALGRDSGADMATYEFDGAGRLFFALPLREESAQVGILVLAYSRDVFQPRFKGLALYGILIGAVILAVLLPMNWYWGRRMAAPLVDLARRMGRAVHGGRDDMPHEVYPYDDELGQLFQAYDAMLLEMREKALLERELVQTERLSAIGRLASGIAHEVNNPLGGMLMAVDTLRERGGLPEHATRTLGLLERGLKQIQETVAALLVQARDQQRGLAPEDIEDVRTLIQPQMLKKSQQLGWWNGLESAVALPAAACRQILINLLLNAVQATAEGGRIGVVVEQLETEMYMAVSNVAEAIPEERLQHLFEPFVSGREGGHGLGLWVTYQIVAQLHGHISAGCADGEVRFEVRLPLETEET